LITPIIGYFNPGKDAGIDGIYGVAGNAGFEGMN
jgi:hypothetical protein